MQSGRGAWGGRTRNLLSSLARQVGCRRRLLQVGCGVSARRVPKSHSGPDSGRVFTEWRRCRAPQRRGSGGGARGHFPCHPTLPAGHAESQAFPGTPVLVAPCPAPVCARLPGPRRLECVTPRGDPSTLGASPFAVWKPLNLNTKKPSLLQGGGEGLGTGWDEDGGGRWVRWGPREPVGVTASALRKITGPAVPSAPVTACGGDADTPQERPCPSPHSSCPGAGLSASRRQAPGAAAVASAPQSVSLHLPVRAQEHPGVRAWRPALAGVLGLWPGLDEQL